MKRNREFNKQNLNNIKLFPLKACNTYQENEKMSNFQKWFYCPLIAKKKLHKNLIDYKPICTQGTVHF
jgi:hypothetical protein